jgi:hypothetical protein
MYHKAKKKMAKNSAGSEKSDYGVAP